MLKSGGASTKDIDRTLRSMVAQSTPPRWSGHLLQGVQFGRAPGLWISEPMSPTSYILIILIILMHSLSRSCTRFPIWENRITDFTQVTITLVSLFFLSSNRLFRPLIQELDLHYSCLCILIPTSNVASVSCLRGNLTYPEQICRGWPRRTTFSTWVPINSSEIAVAWCECNRCNPCFWSQKA
jgi:hypothetical protein